MSPHSRPRPIFKAYDVRGVVPDELDEDVARSIGAAFAEWSGVEASRSGRDCRLSSPSLAAALSEGITSRGADVIDLGLASTDLLYFASGSLDVAGVMLTASHNPPAVQRDEVLPPGRQARRAGHAASGRSATCAERATRSRPARPRARRGGSEMLDAYVEHVLSFVDVVGDATAHGRGRHRERHGRARRPGGVRAAADDGSCTCIPELDGTFPNHPADPIDPENQRGPQARGPRDARPTSGSRSTATRTACSWSTSAPRA